MSRRQTLGNLSPANLNSRASLAPARVTKDGLGSTKSGLAGSRLSLANYRPGAAAAIPVANQRLSMAPPAPRRSSTHAGKPNGPRQDPRPVSDKAYQNSCGRAVIAYLSTHGYDQPVSPKVMASPMTKEYLRMVQFLFRQVDPNLKMMGKVEEDVPALYKQLKYPFAISKSALSAVGSPHSWPHLLAALAWVVELLNYEEKAELVRGKSWEEKQRGDRDFFAYVANSYKFFLAGNDDQASAVEEEKGQEFEQRAADIKAKNEDLQQGIQEVKNELEQLRSQPRPLVAAQQRKTETLSDKEKFVKLVENLQSHKVTLSQKVQERQDDLRAKKEQLEALEEEITELKAKLATQTVNRDDVLRMTNERAKQEEILHSVSAQRETLERRICDQEVQVEHRLENLESQIQAYHTTADRLQLIPATAKRAAGVNYEIKLDRAAVGGSELINLDLKGTVKPALTKLKEEMVLRARELGEQLLTLQERRDAGLDSLTERTEQIATLETQVRKLEMQLRAAKDALEAEVRTTAAQADRIALEVAELRTSAADLLALSQERLMATQGELDKTARHCEQEQAQLASDLAHELDQFAAHKVEVHERFRAALSTMEQQRSAIQALDVSCE